MTIQMLLMEIDSTGTYGVMSDQESGAHMVIRITKDEAGTGFHVSPVEMFSTYAEAALRAEFLNTIS